MTFNLLYPLRDKPEIEVTYAKNIILENTNRLYFAYYKDHTIDPDCANIKNMDAGKSILIAYIDYKITPIGKYIIENSMMIDMSHFFNDFIVNYFFENGTINYYGTENRYEVNINYKTTKYENTCTSSITGYIISDETDSDISAIDDILFDTLIISAVFKQFNKNLKYCSWMPDKIIKKVNEELENDNYYDFILERYNGEIRKKYVEK